MREHAQSASRGVSRATGKRAYRAYMLKARNSRYLPGDPARLWVLLGRSKFNSTEIPTPAQPGIDQDIVKTVFPFYIDGGTSKLWVHVGGNIFEADIGLSGGFSEAFFITATGATPRGTPVGYKNIVIYPIGSNGWSSQSHLLVRTPTAWRLGGHRTPTDDLIVEATVTADPGEASAPRTTQTNYTFRIYDETTDTESAHGEVANIAAFTNPGPSYVHTIRMRWPDGITLNGELGTHVRLYCTLLNEEPGLMYRLDGSDEGIPIANFVAGYYYDHHIKTATGIENENDRLQINGLVRADGEEGTNTWAEHGGEPPQAGGAIIYNDHSVLYDVYGREQDIFYSARGYPEAFPVNFDGDWEYWLRISTSKQDRVLTCAQAGNYLLVFGEFTVYRVSHLPTYTQPGFDRIIQDAVTTEHGICGKYAAASFGISGEDTEDEPQMVIYCSRAHGPILTNGIYDRPILQHMNWETLANKNKLDLIEVVNYSKMQEVWVFYPSAARGETAASEVNNEALIIDYSMMNVQGYGLRVTWPVDVQATDAVQGRGGDGELRLYLLNETERTIYVQDSGASDAQLNYNDSGHIVVEWDFPRWYPNRPTRGSRILRGMVMGQAGSEQTWNTKLWVLDGQEEYAMYDTVRIGAGEADDAFMGGLTGQAFRLEMDRTGLTGDTYDEEDTDCAACISQIMYEVDRSGIYGRTRGT